MKDSVKSQGMGGRPFVPLLHGDTNRPAVMAALRAVGYEGWVGAEVPGYAYCQEQMLVDTARHMELILGMREPETDAASVKPGRRLGPNA